MQDNDPNQDNDLESALELAAWRKHRERQRGSPEPSNPSASIHLIGTDANDPVLQFMVRAKIPLTRQNWIGISYPRGDKPAEWTAEHESEIPKMFRPRG
jgi:hypothetical protein